MRYLFQLLVLSCLSVTNLANALVIINTPITQDETWVSGETYRISGFVDIGSASGVTLTIPDNVTVEFEYGAKLRFGNDLSTIFGRLHAHGTKERPIIFRRAAGATYEEAWGVKIEVRRFDRADFVDGEGFIVEHCHFDKIRLPFAAHVYDEILDFENPTMLVQDCTFDSAAVGAWIDSYSPATAVILRSTFNQFDVSYGSVAGDPQYIQGLPEGSLGLILGRITTSCDGGSYTQVSNCLFRGGASREDARCAGLRCSYLQRGYFAHNIFTGLNRGLSIYNGLNPPIPCTEDLWFICNNIFHANDSPIIDAAGGIFWWSLTNQAFIRNVIDDNTNLDPGMDYIGIDPNNPLNFVDEGYTALAERGYHNSVSAITNAVNQRDSFNDGFDAWIPFYDQLEFFDIDASPPDIGIYGGPFADPESVFVILSPNEEELTRTAWETGTYLVTRNLYLDGVLNSIGDETAPSIVKLLFESDAGLTITGENSVINFVGPDEHRLVFGGLSGINWAGISIQAGLAMFENVDIVDAAGGITFPSVLGSHGAIAINDLTIQNCAVGIDIGHTPTNIDWGTNGNLKIANCGTGIAIRNSANVEIDLRSSNSEISIESPLIDGVTINGISAIQDATLMVLTSHSNALVVDNARYGLYSVNSRIHFDGADNGEIVIRNCRSGVKLQSSSIYCDHVDVSESLIEIGEELYGVELVSVPTADFNYCTFNNHYYSGILALGSNLSMHCCEVLGNLRSGISISGGALSLQDRTGPINPYRGGNNIGGVRGAPPIHILRNCGLLISQGLNQIATETTGDRTSLIKCSFSPAPNPNFIVDGNYWGYTSSGHQTDIQQRLVPPSYFDAVSNYEFDAFEPCQVPTESPASSCEDLWDEAITHSENADYSDAIVDLMTLIEDFAACNLSPKAVYQLAFAMRMNAVTSDSIRMYFLSQISGANEPSLISALKTAAANEIAREDSFATAKVELQSVINDSTTIEFDSLIAKLNLGIILYLEGVSSLANAEGQLVYNDSLDSRIDSVITYLGADIVYCPTIAHEFVNSLPKSEDSLQIEVLAWAEDGVLVDSVTLEFREFPSGEWRNTSMSVVSDCTWVTSVSTDSLGGGVEYRIIAQDTFGRYTTWPNQGSVPWLNDTLTHFVSFEPRLSAPLTDTAYVYAPGVITEDIEIGDGGVLYVLPAPVALDSYVVAIDSGVGITLSSEESEAELIVNGTDSTVIRLECADAGDRWAGISDLGGVVQIDHAELRETVRPMFSAKDVGWPYVRLQDVTISDFALPSFLGSTNSGLDTSFVIRCTFEDGDSTGIIIVEGNSSFDFEDVTIQNCGDDGLVLSEADDLLLTNVRITENGRYGIFTETGTGNSVRLANCYVAFNGDTLPEIKANSYSSIDVSDYAGNIVKDSTGVLFECAEVNDFDAELGSNSFVLADSTGKYFNVTSMSGPSYITGNTFYPESVNDSTFIDDYMKHDTLSKWVYSYLRADNLMDEVIEDPNGSIDFELKAYVQNYLGTVANDTITQVGFKYRVFPDSTNWTTLRQNTIETDSIYDWTVSVGDQGGLISYIWWAKDKHGRYLTSPAGADTTTPDSGATHFLSFEMSDTLIWSGDSVTIWAPTTLTHNLHVKDFGKLVIKPWPGASDHTITLAEGVSLSAVSQNSGLQSARIWIQGTESMPITLDAVNDTSEWEQLIIYKGNLVATYTTFRSNLVAMESGPLATNVLKLDHCTFESSQGYYYVTGTDVADSYIRNCVFRDLGMTWDIGPFLVFEGDIEITDSWFYNNKGPGMTLADARATEISGCNVIANDQSGLLSYGLVSSMSISCSEFSYNGGDTVPEVYMWDGTFDFSDDAGNVFADKGGTLLEGPTMASFELDSGGNGFYLFDSTGHYIVTGDNTDTLDASGNLWFPFTPDTSIFQDYFDPDTSRYWDWASPTASLAECGIGGISSTPGDGPIALIRPTASTYNVPSHGGTNKSANASKSVGKSFGSKSANSVAYDEAVIAQKNRQYAEAKSKFASFIVQNPEHPKTEAALSRFMVSAKKSGQTEGLADFFAREEATSTNPRVKRAAKFLKLNAMVMDGRSQEALDAYDSIIRHPETRHDSITAVIGATRVLYNNRTSRMSTPHPENMPESFTDMCRRVMRLIASERRTNPVLDENPAAPVVPTSYALYQNYPNPFNPSTDIRFDLPEAIRVELKIFNILGQEVVTLVDDVRAAGAYRVLWDGKNAAGLNAASGVYVYQIKTPNFQDAKKMVMIK